MEHLFLRVFLGSPKFWLTGGDELNKEQQLRNAIGFNKNASRFVWGVCDILHYGTPVTAISRIKDFIFRSNRQPAFSRYPLWYFCVMDFHVTRI